MPYSRLIDLCKYIGKFQSEKRSNIGDFDRRYYIKAELYKTDILNKKKDALGTYLKQGPMLRIDTKGLIFTKVFNQFVVHGHADAVIFNQRV